MTLVSMVRDKAAKASYKLCEILYGFRDYQLPGEWDVFLFLSLYQPKVHSCKHIWSKESVEKEAKGGKDELSKKTK